jgi:hypothetical protein
MAQRQHKDDKPLWLPGMYKRVPAERQRAIARMRAIVARHNPDGRSLADELIAERRAEAARD